MDDFVVRAVVAGVGVAVIAGPLGCFVVWRRMAYFGATLSHAALLGVAIGLLLDVSPMLAVMAVSVIVSLLLVALQRARLLTDDTLLGIMAHAALAFGLVALAFLETVRVDLLAYLFGDILSVGTIDIAWIYGGGVLCLAVLAWRWNQLLAATVHEDLARVEGIDVAASRLFFMLLMALVIAIAMKIVGILLIVSLLIIPAATMRPFAASPEGMAIGAAALGALAVVSGLAASVAWNPPAGPAIVAASAVLFALSLALKRFGPAAAS